MNLRLKSNKDMSKASEKNLARQFGGKVQPASGAIDRFDLKADVVTDNFLFDDR